NGGPDGGVAPTVLLTRAGANYVGAGEIARVRAVHRAEVEAEDVYLLERVIARRAVNDGAVLRRPYYQEVHVLSAGRQAGLLGQFLHVLLHMVRSLVVQSAPPHPLLRVHRLSYPPQHLFSLDTLVPGQQSPRGRDGVGGRSGRLRREAVVRQGGVLEPD